MTQYKTILTLNQQQKARECAKDMRTMDSEEFVKKWDLVGLAKRFRR